MFLPLLKRWIPTQCPMNELYKFCTGNCSDCTERGRCIVTKCEEGCDCAPRFFRVTPDGPCEPVANCPKPECGENEIFRACGPVCETCTSFKCNVISCDYKCYCKEGYLRNKNGTCIPKEECPIRSQCTRYEEWAESGPIDEFCLSGAEEDVNNRTQNVEGCYCTEGHKRNLLGYCLNETLCSNVRCYGVEVYRDCIPKCNTTCRNYGDPNCTEDGNCYPGCFCPDGYVMNDFRACIKVENCSLDIEQVKVINKGYAFDDNDTDTTLSPASVTTDETTLADDWTSPDDTTESVTQENIEKEEKISITTSEQTVTYASLTSASPAMGTTAKEKTKDKVLKLKETKHENIAKNRDAYKYKFEEDEDGFGNDNI